MRKIPIALELYTVRDLIAKDVAGILRAVAHMGYEGVEFFGSFIEPEILLPLLKETGLVPVGWHTAYDLLSDENYGSTIAYLGSIGISNVVVPWYQVDTAQQWREFAEDMQRIALKLRADGFSLGYHNHEHEHRELDGTTPLDILLTNAPDVFMQFDTGNGLEGGAKAVEYFAKYPNRSKTVHLKPYSHKDGMDTMIGDDDCDWQGIFAACQAGDTQWYIVEYESAALYDQMTGAKMCLDALRRRL